MWRFWCGCHIHKNSASVNEVDFLTKEQDHILITLNIFLNMLQSSLPSHSSTTLPTGCPFAIQATGHLYSLTRGLTQVPLTQNTTDTFMQIIHHSLVSYVELPHIQSRHGHCPLLLHPFPTSFLSMQHHP